MDLRSSERVPVDLEAEIHAHGQVFRGTVLNCSLSGVFMRTDEKLVADEIIEVKIFIPGIVDPVSASSRVIWTDWSDKYPPGFGIHFVSLTDDQARILRTFLYE